MLPHLLSLLPSAPPPFENPVTCGLGKLIQVPSSSLPPSLPLWLDLELVGENFFSNPVNCYDHLKRIFTTEALTLPREVIAKW